MDETEGCFFMTPSGGFSERNAIKKSRLGTAPELGSVPMFLTKFTQSSLIYIGFAL